MPITDGTLHYDEYGSGMPLLLVAGLGGVGSFWKPQVDALSPHFRVVTHDHRGTGKSSRDLITYSVVQMARDVLDLADGLGIKRFHFAGHSTGAAIGQELAMRHPDRLLSAVLSSGWAEADPYFLRCFETRKTLLAELGPEAYVRAQALFVYPPWYIAANDAALSATEAAQIANFPPVEIVLSRIAAITAYAPGPALAAIKTPTLVVGAADDQLTQAHESVAMHRHIAHSDLAILPSGGHFNTMTKPDQFNATLVSWLLAQRDGVPWVRPPSQARNPEANPPSFIAEIE
jgi:aminoacrylate hydrolase